MKQRNLNRRVLAFFLSFAIIITSLNISAFAIPQEETENYIVIFQNENSKEKFKNNKNNNKKVKQDFEQQASVAIELTASDIAELSANADVLHIERDSPMELLATGKPDKTAKAVQQMNKHGQGAPWGIVSLGVIPTINKYDGKKIKVAVFDTGISKHEDLTIKGGVSFVNYTNNYSDDNGHGTHVAGTISANNNKFGVVGVAPDAEIYAVKILDKNGGGSYSSIIAALEWAIANEIDIINMSLGGSNYSAALHTAIQQAVNAGIIIVAAAGNKGEGDDTMMYPAKYPEVVAVGAVGEDYKVASYSSRSSSLNMSAPGTSVLSTLNDGTYAVLSGTSMAAPHVTGALAALKSKNKKMTSVELINRIYETATALGNSSDYGNGFLNFAYAAGEINGAYITVPVGNPDYQGGNSDNEDNDKDNNKNEEIPIDVTFDITSYDVRINEYKQRLLTFRDLAHENGDITLAKEISDKFEELFARDYVLHELPENLQNPPKGTNEALASDTLINSYFISKSSDFQVLQNDYLSCFDYYHNIIVDKGYQEAKQLGGNETGDLANDNDSVDSNSSFDVAAYNKRIDEYKEKLIMFRNTAQENGNVALAAEIGNKLEKLAEIYTMLSELPENASETEKNNILSSKSSHFDTLENDYLAYIGYCEDAILHGFNSAEDEMSGLSYGNDSTFDIAAYNKRISEDKEKLIMFRDTAQENGNFALAAEIGNKLEKLAEIYTMLSELPEDISETEKNNVFSAKSNHFDTLENDYLAYIDYCEDAILHGFNSAEDEMSGLSYGNDSTFDIAAYNKRISEDKEKLIMFRDTAQENGNFALATEIGNKLEKLAEIYTMLSELPEDVSETEKNNVFSAKSNHFNALENDYLAYIGYYNAVFYEGLPYDIDVGNDDSILGILSTPTLYTNPATNVTYNSAQLNGYTSGTNGNMWYYGFEYWDIYGNTTIVDWGNSPYNGDLCRPIWGLSSGMTYYYRPFVYANNLSYGTKIYGSISNFYTPAINMTPTLYTNPATNVTYNSAQLNGYTSGTNGNMWYYGFEYWDVYGNTTIVDWGNSLYNGDLCRPIWGLSSGMTYYYRPFVYANNLSYGTRIYGPIIQFNTPAINMTPTLYTNPATNITYNSAQLNAYTIGTNGNMWYYGFEYWDVYGNTSTVNWGYSTYNGDLWQSIWGLSSGMTYYYRPFVYANNLSYGTKIYGSTSSFYTPTQLSTIFYDANGGYGAPVSQSVSPYSYTYLSYTIPYRTNYTFLGWSTDRYATSPSFSSGSYVYVGGSVTLYAVWAPSATQIYLNNFYDVSLPAGNYSVYAFTPTSTNSYNIFTGPYGGTGASNDTYLELYSDSALTNRIAYNDDSNGTLFSQIVYNMAANTTYYIKLRHYSSGTGVHARFELKEVQTRRPNNVIKAEYKNTHWEAIFGPNDLDETWSNSDSIQLIYTTPYIQNITTDGTNKKVLKFTTYYQDKDCIIFQAYNSTKDSYSDVKINFSITSDLRFANCTFASAMINKSSAPFPVGVVVIDQRSPLVEVPPDGHSSVMKAADMSNEMSAQTPDVIVGATDYGTISITPITTSTGKYRIFLPDGKTEHISAGGKVLYDSPFAAIYQLTKMGAKDGEGYLVKDTTRIDVVVFQYSSINTKFYVFRGKNFHGTTTNSDHMRNFTSNHSDVHIVRSDGIYAANEVSVDQPYAHSSKVHLPGGTVVSGSAGEGNTGAYVYRKSENNNKYYKMTETIDFSNMKLKVNDDVNNNIKRNGFIYISSSMNNGDGWTSCDLGLVVNGNSLGGHLKLTAYLYPSIEGRIQKYENRDANLIKPKDDEPTKNGTIREYSYTGIYTLTYEYISEYVSIEGVSKWHYGMKCTLKNEDKVHDTITVLLPGERVKPNPVGNKTETSYVNFTAGTSFVPKFDKSGGTLDNISSGDELTGIKRSKGRIYYVNDNNQKDDKWYYPFDGNLQTNTTKRVTQYMTDKVSYTKGSIEVIDISYKD